MRFHRNRLRPGDQLTMGRPRGVRATSTLRGFARRVGIAWCILFAATSAWAGPFEDGVKAYGEGKFEAALTLW